MTPGSGTALRGNDILVSVNGYLLATVTDARHQGGEVGLTQWAEEDTPGIGRFDNFAVRQLGCGMLDAERPQEIP